MWKINQIFLDALRQGIEIKRGSRRIVTHAGGSTLYLHNNAIIQYN